MKEYYVYILTNFTNSVFYVGVTNDIIRRTYEHKNKINKGFSEKYKIDKLVYYENTNDSITAIEREKQIKSWSRNRKLKLITENNPNFVDLYDNFM